MRILQYQRGLRHYKKEIQKMEKQWDYTKKFSNYKEQILI